MSVVPTIANYHFYRNIHRSIESQASRIIFYVGIYEVRLLDVLFWFWLVFVGNNSNKVFLFTDAEFVRY